MEKVIHNPEIVASQERFRRALDTVCEKYPELSESILESLRTPQIGEYHNEGERMDSHLSLILENLQAIIDNRFDASIADGLELTDLLKRVAVSTCEDDPAEIVVNPVLVEYTFLHDIAKKDCLTIKLEGEKDGIEITWQEWLKIEDEGKPYQLDGKPIRSISYFHASEGADGQHGNKGVKMLQETNLPEEILVAIAKHEVAYQFGKINAATYEKHFVEPGYTDLQQEFIIAASYIDTAASLKPDMTADMANFVNLVNSRENYLLIRKAMDSGAKIKENDLAALKKRDIILSEEDIVKVTQGEARYNPVVLRSKLEEQGELSEEEINDIVTIAVEDPAMLGKKFGPKMRFIKPLLEMSLIS